jgi:hypothetical protein
MAPAVSERRRRSRAERRAEFLASQRRERARRAAKSRRAAERRRALRGLLPRLGLAVASLGMCLLWTGPPEPSHEQLLTAPAGNLVRYLIDYRVQYLGGVVNTEHHVVSRPTLGLDETFKSGRLTGGQLSNQDGLWTWATGPPSGWDLLSSAPQVAVSDPDPVPAINYAIQRGLAAVVGTGRVLGRACSVVLTGQPLGESIAAPGSGGVVRFCIDDRTGAVLAEDWHLDGKLAERLTAIRFDPAYRPPPGTFSPEPRLQATSTPPPIVAAPLTPAQRKALHPGFVPPTGYHFLRAVVAAEAGPGGGPQTFTSSLLFANPAGRVLEVDYAPGAADRSGIPTSIGSGRTGYLRLDYYLSAFSVSTSPSASVVIRGSDPDLLVAVGRQLRW